MHDQLTSLCNGNLTFYTSQVTLVTFHPPQRASLISLMLLTLLNNTTISSNTRLETWKSCLTPPSSSELSN